MEQGTGQRVEDLLAAMTLDEQAAMTAGIDMWHATGCERLGLRGLKVSDGPNGARGSLWAGTTSACTPCGTALASTWDPELVRRVGELLGRETRTKGADLLLAPTVNLHRSPLAGRNFECWSEDPHLTSELAVAYVSGVQSQGVGAAIKHLVANDSEFERHTISSEVDERTLRELYLVPFEAAVTRAKVMSVMAAYNRLNGTYCAEHPDLIAYLDEWGFDGFMISDWWGTQSTDASAHHGVDLEMPGPATHLGSKLAEAVVDGRVGAEMVTAKVRRLLGVMERVGVMDRPEHLADQSVDRPQDRDLLREAARRAVVLLRNEPVGPAEAPALPLRPGQLDRLAVLGPNADVHLVQGGGSAQVNPHHTVTILDGLRTRYGPTVQLDVERGCDAYRFLPPLDHRWTDRGGCTIDYFDNRELAGDPVLTHHVASPRLAWMGSPGPGVTAGAFSARLHTRVSAPPETPLDVSMIVGGHGRMTVDGLVVADMWDHYEPGTAFFGIGSAELRSSVPAGATVDLEVEFACFEGLGAAALMVGGLPRLADDAMQRAVDAAHGADAALVVVGLNQDWETEGADRHEWGLPGDQAELIRRVGAVQPRTIVLVQAGSPVDMSWADDVAAVAQIWYLGQETGDAVADLVSGDHSPSGRLPTTLPYRYDDHRSVADYPGDNGRVHYREGVFIGYRSFDARGIEPRWCFGHGLGYSTIEMSAAEWDGEAVQVNVANTGAVDDHAVVQVYVRPPVASVPRPPQELAGFVTVPLRAGESRGVRIELRDRAFRHWDPGPRAWVETPGRYELAVGASSRNLPMILAVDRSGDQPRA